MKEEDDEESSVRFQEQEDHQKQQQQQQQQQQRNTNNNNNGDTTKHRERHHRRDDRHRRHNNNKPSHQNSSGRKNHHHYHRSDTHEKSRRYLYSAISATFFFVLFRELGWIDTMQTTLSETEFLRPRIKHDEQTSSSYGNSGPSLASAAANMAATSMQMPNFQTTTGSAGQTGQLLGNSNNYLSKADMMEHVKQTDNSITPGSRPIMYTFFEWIPPRSRGTSMSDVADKTLISEWKAAWKAAGWHPIVLTLDDVKKHEKYADYAPKLSKIPMMGVDGLGGTVIYNQLCFLRWLAVAAVGGGFMADYDVFPISNAPPANQLEAPYDGNFTVYSRIKHSKRAGIPCLMSGRADEWTRMAYALLDNGEKNSGTETMWSDMLALIDMRNDGVYKIFDAVMEGQDVLLKRGWTGADCNTTTNKQAIHFSHEALRLGYLPPGESAEDRPEIIRRFLKHWYQLCGSQTDEKAMLGDLVSS